MREAIIIGSAIGLFFGAVGVVMTALGIKYAADSPLWDYAIGLGVAFILVGIVTITLYVSSERGGRPFMGPELLINTAICMIALGIVWHFSKTEKVDADYFYFEGRILNSKNLTAEIPLVICNNSTAPFEDVDPWFSPAEVNGNAFPQDETNPYWSRRDLKVFWPKLQHGSFLYGKSVPPRAWRIEVESNFKGTSNHFLEILEFVEYQGKLIQVINVWKTVAGETAKLVHSVDERSKSSQKRGASC